MLEIYFAKLVGFLLTYLFEANVAKKYIYIYKSGYCVSTILNYKFP